MTADQFTQLMAFLDYSAKAIGGLLCAVIVAVTWRG